MVRMLLAIFLCVALAVVYHSTAQVRAIDGLVRAPWGQEPGKIGLFSVWREYPYGEMDDRMGYGYAFTMRKKVFNSDLNLRLFTYVEPSLDRIHEVTLMGAVERREVSEVRARALQDRFLARLRAKGFAESASDRVVFAGTKNIHRERITPIARGYLNGHVYSCFDSLRNAWFVRAVIQHPLAREYGNEYASWWPRWWQHDRFSLPERLVGEIETTGITGLFPPGDWARIRDIPRTRGSEVSLSDLERFFERADPEKVSPSLRPALFLLKNYLARYLFVYGIAKIPNGNWFADEKFRYLMVDHLPRETRRQVLYDESFLFRIARDYPDSFWGQFAFLETFRMGLTPPTEKRKGRGMEMMRGAGRDFLTRYPRSEIAPEILFLLGRLAEAEYSANIIQANRSFHGKNRWRDYPLSPFVEENRQLALDMYGQVLASPMRPEYEEYLKFAFPRLLARVGTGCTYYWWR